MRKIITEASKSEWDKKKYRNVIDFISSNGFEPSKRKEGRWENNNNTKAKYTLDFKNGAVTLRENNRPDKRGSFLDMKKLLQYLQTFKFSTKTKTKSLPKSVSEPQAQRNQPPRKQTQKGFGMTSEFRNFLSEIDGIEIELTAQNSKQKTIDCELNKTRAFVKDNSIRVVSQYNGRVVLDFHDVSLLSILNDVIVFSSNLFDNVKIRIM